MKPLFLCKYAVMGYKLLHASLDWWKTQTNQFLKKLSLKEKTIPVVWPNATFLQTEK